MNEPQPHVFNIMFVITSMPVGGAEILLTNMIRQMDRNLGNPQICCLKEMGVLGEELASEIPVYENMIRHKYDVGIMGRLRRLYKDNKIDAVVTVGAGDKMFWGRLAAKRARVPVILSALHSTGWPDGVGRLNRILTPITDGFIAVAENHGKFLVEGENFPPEKVFVVPNGVDTNRFQHSPESRADWRSKVGIPTEAPTIGIVAALRPEKNHKLFLKVAAQVNKSHPETHFVVAGDGPIRGDLEQQAADLQIKDKVHFLGSVSDIPGVLSMLDVFALTSDNEASPVSILEAMSCGLPVVATDVGSVSQSVIESTTGYLVPTHNVEAATSAWLKLLNNRDIATEFGTNGRDHVLQYSSLEKMTDSYLDLISGIYQRKILNRPDTSQLKMLSLDYPVNTVNQH